MASTSDPILIRWFIGLGTGTTPAQVAVEQAVADDFNAVHTDIHLSLEIVPNATARDTLAAEIAAGVGPDIIGPVGWMSSNQFHGQWLDLASLITSTSFDTSIFDPTLVSMYQTDEGQVGLPFAVYTSAIYYNPALFDAAGLHYPPAHYGDQYVMPGGSMVDWSWDTLTQVAKLLTLDNTGKNSTQTGFNQNNILQYGFSYGWEGHPNYWGSFWHAGQILQGTPGAYTAVVPDTWKAAWQWVYDGMWGAQPYIPNGEVSGSADFDSGNVFASGKIAMLDNPSWYLCCVSDLTNAGGTFQFGAMPTYNGAVGGRVDADTFRIWKDTPHPDQAFEVLSYLVTTGVDKLIVGSPGTPGAYGALTAITSKQQPWWDAQAANSPFVTQASWNILKAGLNYPDVPHAEGYMPNINEAWARIQTFGDLLVNTAGVDLAAQETILEADLTNIFNTHFLSISGNAGVGGATLNYTDGSATANDSGDYLFTVPSGWTGTVTPSKTGYNFTPANRIYTNVLTDQTDQNYTASGAYRIYLTLVIR